MRRIPSGTDAPAVSASRARLADTDALAFTTDAASERALVDRMLVPDADVRPVPPQPPTRAAPLVAALRRLVPSRGRGLQSA